MIIVLFQPEIPQNAGNIVRTCAVTGNDLVLVRPLGFTLNDKKMKRAGLDYWEGVNVQLIDDLEFWLKERPDQNVYFFSSKANRSYAEVQYKKDDILVFGSETSGLSEEIYQKYSEQLVKIPMLTGARCLNLSNSVAVATYEAWRQQGFQGL